MGMVVSYRKNSFYYRSLIGSLQTIKRKGKTYMIKLEKNKKDFILFLEAGFIAVNQADELSALNLFSAAEVLEPKNPLIKI
jgi:hypothetical protein